MSLKGKRIVITGASSGIGRALAIESVKRGASVCIGARSKDKLAALVVEFPHANILTFELDVTSEESCKRFIAFANQGFGGIDILINNAGVSMRANFAQTAPHVLEQVMQVNFWGAVYCTHAAMPALLKSKGTVVGMSSVAGFSGLPGRTGYSASKFAMHGFLEALRVENLHTGLHVMIACPGFTATNIRETALNEKGNVQKESPRDEGKMMSPEQVASRVLVAIEQKKELLLISKEAKLSFWLKKFFPRFLQKMTYKHMKAEPNAPF
jgi:short-subunit dehydrogenase